MVLQRCLRDKAGTRCGNRIVADAKALHALSECYSRWADEKQKKLDSLPPKSRNVFKGDKELIDSLRSQAADYQKQAEEWMLPEGD